MKIIHQIDSLTKNEEFVCGIGKSNRNYRFISQSPWNHKRLVFSVNRWIRHGITVIVSSRSENESSMVEIEKEKILKILQHFDKYLRICGVNDYEQIKDVILN